MTLQFIVFGRGGFLLRRLLPGRRQRRGGGGGGDVWHNSSVQMTPLRQLDLFRILPSLLHLFQLGAKRLNSLTTTLLLLHPPTMCFFFFPCVVRLLLLWVLCGGPPKTGRFLLSSCVRPCSGGFKIPPLKLSFHHGPFGTKYTSFRLLHGVCFQLCP